MIRLMSVYQLMSSMRLNAVVNPLVTCQACNDIKLPCLKICLEKSLQKKTLVLNRIVCTSMYAYGAFFLPGDLNFRENHSLVQGSAVLRHIVLLCSSTCRHTAFLFVCMSSGAPIMNTISCNIEFLIHIVIFGLTICSI